MTTSATDGTANSSPADSLSSAASLGTAAPDISPAQNADTQAPAATPPSGDNPASSPDAPADDKAGLLAAVQKVVEAKPKTPPQGEGTPAAPELSSDANPNPDAQATAEAAPDADPTDDELKGMVPKTKARIEKLLGQRNAARTETESLKPLAAKWQQMDGYLTRHDLAPEDVNLLLGVGAALRRGDFKAFLDGVKPYVELCNQALGHTLPADLQAKVEAGEVSTETARELSTTRFAKDRLEGQVQASTKAATAAAQAEADARVASVVQSAVVAWEQGVQARDPDYARKAPAVLRVSQALMAEHGRPRTAEAAVELAKRAYEEANRMFAGVMPAPVPTRPQPNGARAVNNARPEPKTLMEAALLGLERSRA